MSSSAYWRSTWKPSASRADLMLSPSEIQRVDDCVGIATPMRPPAAVSVLESDAVLPQPARTTATVAAAAAMPIIFLNKVFPFGFRPDQPITLAKRVQFASPPADWLPLGYQDRTVSMSGRQPRLRADEYIVTEFHLQHCSHVDGLRLTVRRRFDSGQTVNQWRPAANAPAYPVGARLPRTLRCLHT